MLRRKDQHRARASGRRGRWSGYLRCCNSASWEPAREAGADNVTFDVGDASCLAYADRSFDVVFASSVIHHLDVATLAREIARVTKTGGVAIFLEPLGHNPLIRLYRSWTPAARTTDERPLRASDLALLKREWQSATVSYYDLFTLAAVPLRRIRSFSRLVAVAASLDAGFFRMPLAWRLAWFALIQLEGPK